MVIDSVNIHNLHRHRGCWLLGGEQYISNHLRINESEPVKSIIHLCGKNLNESLDVWFSVSV